MTTYKPPPPATARDYYERMKAEGARPPLALVQTIIGKFRKRW